MVKSDLDLIFWVLVYLAFVSLLCVVTAMSNAEPAIGLYPSVEDQRDLNELFDCVSNKTYGLAAKTVKYGSGVPEKP